MATNHLPNHLPTIELPQCLEFLKLKNFPLKVNPPVYEAPKLQHDTLYIYGPGWKKTWASFDAESLAIQAYLVFCGVEFRVYNCNEPEASPSGQLPFLATVTGATFDSDKIHDWLKDRQKEKRSENLEAQAYIALAQSKLHAAWLYSMWLEPYNYSEFTAKAYFGHLPQPIKYILANRKQGKVVQNLLASRDVLVREEIYEDAAKALEALSVKLGDDKYFFNASEPTWTDAVIFSYLHCIMAAPQVKGSTLGDEEKKQAMALRGLVRRHDNLVRYARNIYETYLQK